MEPCTSHLQEVWKPGLFSSALVAVCGRGRFASTLELVGPGVVRVPGNGIAGFHGVHLGLGFDFIFRNGERIRFHIEENLAPK